MSTQNLEGFELEISERQLPCLHSLSTFYLFRALAAGVVLGSWVISANMVTCARIILADLMAGVRVSLRTIPLIFGANVSEASRDHDVKT